VGRLALESFASIVACDLHLLATDYDLTHSGYPRAEPTLHKTQRIVLSTVAMLHTELPPGATRQKPTALLLVSGTRS